MSAQLVQKHYDFNEKNISEGKYSAWELIEPFWYMVSIYDSLDVYHREAEPLSDAQRKLLALFWYDAEVCNGGHSQFFFNSTGIVWKDAIEGMRLVGAAEYAENFQKAIDVFGGSVPFDRSERIAALETFSKDENFDDFHQMDMFYYGDANDICKRMDDYVKLHPAEFAVNGEYPAMQV